MNDTYLYPYSSAEARDRNELPLWRESHKANIACREAIRPCWMASSLSTVRQCRR